MKKLLIALALSSLPIFAHADVSIGIRIAPGVVVHIGDRDPHGRYWDGGVWRDPDWWEENGRGFIIHFGDYDDRGYRWDGERWRDRRWWEQNEARARAAEHEREFEHERHYGHNYYSDEGRRGEYREDEHRDDDHGDRGWGHSDHDHGDRGQDRGHSDHDHRD